MRIGVDLGGTNVAVGLVSDGRILAKSSLGTDSSDYRKIIKDIAGLINGLCESTGNTVDDIESIGIGTPGSPDKENGTVSNVFNITDEKIDFRRELSKYFAKDIFIENDARCAMLGEYFSGSARGYKNVVMITLGTGVGGGIIIDDKLYAGSNYAAGEIGHMTICMDGEKCKCGEYGCYEQYASVTALIRIAKSMIEDNSDNEMYSLIKSGQEPDGRFIFEQAHKNNPLAQDILKIYTKNVAVGLVNIVNIFRPEIVVVGGGVSAQGDFLLNPIREYVQKHVFAKNMCTAEIKSAMLGNDAGIIGAAMLKE